MKHTDHHSSHHHHHDGDCCHHKHPAAEAATASHEVATPAPEVQDPAAALQAEVNKYRDQSLRAAADLENFRKRMAREKEEAIRYANVSLLEKLIPILDNFELGLEVAKTASDGSAASIAQGLSMVQRQLADFIKDHGVTAVEAVGQPFDPKLHEAIGHEPHAQISEGSVISQVRRGYKLVDRLIRPAAVIVSKGDPGYSL
ncbi:MAG: nucleotide exchange factor GrpE [Verrucomicrobia bacterium]|nr:nucleotide exchange factor GrpE [Verrucomicrobiota bacterium]